MREKITIKIKDQVKLGDVHYKTDEFNRILMNKKDYTSAKINLVRKYYSKALGIFAGTVNKNRNKEPKPFPGYAYVVDLFSGSGLYEDGTLGTPLTILEAYNTLISVSPHLENTIIFIFNDYEERNIKSLSSHSGLMDHSLGSMYANFVLMAATDLPLIHTSTSYINY